MLISFDGSGQIPSAEHLLIQCASIPNILVLCEFPENSTPYELGGEGWDRSDGRSLTGSLKVKGNLYTARRIWRLSFLVNSTQGDTFESLLAAQKNGQQLQLVDNFSVGGGAITNVFLDVDDRYLSPIAGNWYLLQFMAREDV